MKNRITKKHMQNKRFRRTEEAIFKAFFDGKNLDRVNVLVKNANISRATFYRHHKTLYRIASDYEKCILDEYKGMIQGRAIDDRNEKIDYYIMLAYLRAHKRIFKVLVGKSKMVEEMVKVIERKREKKRKMPKNSSIINYICIKEMAGVIEDWGRRGFIKSEMEEVIDSITYLSKTARVRLAPLLK